MSVDFRLHQAANRRKTWFLLIGMFIALIAVVWAFGTWFGMSSAAIVPIAIAIGIGGVWWSYWKSDALVLRMTNAHVISQADAPQLWNVVEEVCIASGLPMPRVAIVDDEAPNAFATGRDPEHAVIAFTTGILRVMDREQLQGVAAHEMAHVGNRDTLVMAVAATTAGILAIIADIGARMTLFGGRRDGNNPIAAILALGIMLLAPIAALLLRSAVSRRREALADATAVAFTRNPNGLRRALEELARDNTVVQARSTAVAHVWIECPLGGRDRSLFATHPPMSERIALLRQMEGLPPAQG